MVGKLVSRCVGGWLLSCTKTNRGCSLAVVGTEGGLHMVRARM